MTQNSVSFSYHNKFPDRPIANMAAISPKRGFLVATVARGWLPVFTCAVAGKTAASQAQPPLALRFSQGRGERLAMNRKGPSEGYRRRRSACQILCRFLGKKVVFLARPNSWSLSWKRSILVAYCCKHCKL